MATGLKVGTTGTEDVMFGGWRNSDGSENYKCRAWVTFNGSGTVAILASGNISSVTDNGVGDYSLNFASTPPDSNYSVVGTGTVSTSGTGSTAITVQQSASGTTPKTTAAARIWCKQGAAVIDATTVDVAIFR